jgi:Tol biopolymer transport system component
MRVRVVAASAVVATVCSATGAAFPTHPAALRATTLAVVPGGIGAFAQDGSRLAWIRLGVPCGRRIEAFDLRSKRRVSLEQRTARACSGSSGAADAVAIAIAGPRVVWENVVGYGNTQLYRRVLTAVVSDRRTRTADELGIFGDLDTWPPPLVAGDDATLVFHSACNGGEDCHPLRNDVRAIVGGRARRLFRLSLPSQVAAGDVVSVASLHPRPLGLAAAGTDVAVLEDLYPCPCNESPQWSPDGAQIAWSRAGTIYVMNADGSGKRRLTPVRGAGSRVQAPRWSPDGAKLAYGYRRQTYRGPSELHVVDADGSGNRRLTAGSEPWWSPSGQKLSFVRDSDVWTINSDGTGERRLTSDRRGAPTGAVWSPDGAKLVAARGKGGESRDLCSEGLYVIRADGGGQTRIARADECGPSTPRWSPSGDRIAFGDNGRVVVGTETGERRTLGTGAHPVWSPDGTRLSFTLTEQQTGRIAVVSASVAAPVAITPPSLSAARPSWSPDGGTIAFGDVAPEEAFDRRRAGIYSVAADGSALRKLAPDGQTGVDLRDARTGGRIASFLVPGDGYRLALSRSYAALFVRAASTQATLLQLYQPRTGTLVRSIPVSTTIDARPSLAVSDDGIAVFAVGRRIRALDARTGAIRTLADARSRPIGLSIDGRRLAWAENRGRRGVVRALVLPPRLG